MENIPQPICPFHLYFEGDEKICIQEKCDYNQTLHQCSMGCKDNDKQKCFTCGSPATHRSKTITPAGYHAYQCEQHAITEPLWGSDPDWPTEYISIPKENQDQETGESE